MSLLRLIAVLSIALPLTVGRCPRVTSHFTNTYLVLPHGANSSSCTNASAEASQCQEWDLYVRNASRYFVSKTLFVFLPGIHLSTSNEVLNLSNISDLSMVGASYAVQRNLSTKVGEYGFSSYHEDDWVSYKESSSVIQCTGSFGFHFSNVSRLFLVNLTIQNCGAYLNYPIRAAVSLCLTNVRDLYANGLSVQNGTGYGLFGLNLMGESCVKDSSFVGNNQAVKNLLIPLNVYNYGRYYRGCDNKKPNMTLVAYFNNGSLAAESYVGGNVLLLFGGDRDAKDGITYIEFSSSLVALGVDASLPLGYAAVHSLYTSYSGGTGLAFHAESDGGYVAFTMDRVYAYRNQAGYGANFQFSVFTRRCRVTMSYCVSSKGVFEVSDVNYFFNGTNSEPFASSSDPPLEVDSKLLVIYSSDFHCGFGSDNAGLHMTTFEATNATIEIVKCNFTSTLAHLASSDRSFIFLEKCEFYSQAMYKYALKVYGCRDVLIKDSFFNLGLVEFSGVRVVIFDSTFDKVRTRAYNSSRLTLSGNVTYHKNFNEGIGGAVTLLSSSLTFGENSSVWFVGNYALYGGGLYVDSYSNIYLENSSSVKFLNNTAFFTGGAIQVENTQPYYRKPCFVHLINKNNEPDLLTSAEIYFEGNTALSSGSVLYGGDIDNCFMDNANSSKDVFDKILKIGPNNDSTASVSSDGLYVSMCDPDSFNGTLLRNFSSQTIYPQVYPGQTLKMGVIAGGQMGGVTPSIALIYSKSSTTKVIASFQTNGTCQNVFIPYMPSNTTQHINIQTLYSFTNYPLGNTIDMRLSTLPCPSGFVFEITSCVCDEALQHYDIDCDINTLLARTPGNLWVGPAKDGVMAVTQCSFDYCTGADHVNLSAPDTQCNYGRRDVLCGACPEGLSSTFGTSQCQRCSDLYLLLIIPFAVMGLAMVAFLFALNLTVATGHLNGIVFYANLIRINKEIFFSRLPTSDAHAWSTIVASYNKGASTFMAWLNLDFGLGVCFYDGMDGYSKTWLQFVFPVYVLILVTAIAFAGRYSALVSRLCRFNAVAVLATLVMLSHSKFITNIINILSYNRLFKGRLRAVDVVWSYDGRIEYFGPYHVPLFVVGLLATCFFALPYPAFLLFAPRLQSLSHVSGLSWVNRIKPFLDAHQAPYKDRYRFWAGVLLAIRLFLYLVFTIATSEAYKLMGIIFVGLIYVFLLSGLSVYKSRWTLVMETFLVINIVTLSVVKLAASNNQASEDYALISVCAVAVGVTCAIACFVGIVVYHIRKRWAAISAGKQQLHLRSTASLIQTLDNDNNAEYREPLLGE